MALLTGIFSILTVVYNFVTMPPYGGVRETMALTSSLPKGSSTTTASAGGGGQAPSSAGAPAASAAPEATSPASETAQAPTSVSYPLNLNTATKEQLMTLSGIGDTLAQRIVDYRAQNGPFQSVDELDNVKGIGPKTIEKIRPYLTVG